MEIDRYTAEAHRHLALFLDALAAEGMADLARSLSALGMEGAHALADRRPDLVHDLAIAKPREWSKLLAGIDDLQERHGYLLLACYRLRLGYAWRTCAAASAADTSVRIHPLTMTMRGADSAVELLSGPPTLWPFDDGRDPLDEDRQWPSIPE